MSTTFHYPLRSGSSTRLLILHPGVFDDAISCQLSEVDLNDRPRYEAISYTWGSESDQKTIRVNGMPLQIRHNLFSCLRRLRHPSQQPAFWVDALSISQTDLDEKSQQVAMIGRIFQQARRVRAWIGEHEDNSEALFRERPALVEDPGFNRQTWVVCYIRLRSWGASVCIAGLMSPMIPLVGIGVWRSDSALLYICCASAVGLLSLVLVLYLLWLLGRRATQRELWYSIPEWRSFLLRDYWRRTWVVQEVALARKVIVHCGNDSTSWEELIEGRIGQIKSSGGRLGVQFRAQLLSSYHGRFDDESVVFLNSLRHDEMDWMLQNSEPSIYEMMATYAGRSSLIELAYSTRHTECADQRDRIFALLSVENSIDIVSTGSTPPIVPDYTMSVPELAVILLRRGMSSPWPKNPELLVQYLYQGLKVTRSQEHQINELLHLPKTSSLKRIAKRLQADAGV